MIVAQIWDGVRLVPQENGEEKIICQSCGKEVERGFTNIAKHWNDCEKKKVIAQSPLRSHFAILEVI